MRRRAITALLALAALASAIGAAIIATPKIRRAARLRRAIAALRDGPTNRERDGIVRDLVYLFEEPDSVLAII